MMPIIVADTGPLIALAKLQQLDLLSRLFAKVHVPKTVYEEATHDLKREDACLIATFITHSQISSNIHNTFVDKLAMALDEGEIQALALAKELNCGVLMDERRGRRVAKHYHIPAIGTLGVLLQAKQTGAIETIKPLIEVLQLSGYRFSEKLIEAALWQAGE